MTDKLNLEGKIALVTGAAELLGRQHSIALVEKGAVVYMADIKIDQLNSSKGIVKSELPQGKFETLQLDVTSEESISFSRYWADKNIRVNALSPGGVSNNQPDEFVEKVSGFIPLGRMANQDEYISSVQFLCSEASSYMTGQNIVVEGGRSVW